MGDDHRPGRGSRHGPGPVRPETSAGGSDPTRSPTPPPGGLLLRTDDSPFSYACHACGRCCRDRRVSINPYEAVRLAARLGTTTGQLLERFVTRDGTVLRHRADGTCVFLGKHGCTVHPDRPLACRLYPLGAVWLGEGRTGFVELEPDPLSEGEYGEDGTVGDYLRSQETEPYWRANTLYRRLLASALERVGPGALRSAEGGPGSPSPGPEHSGPGNDATVEGRRAWLDVDAVVERYAARTGLRVPDAVEAKCRFHLRALALELGVDGEEVTRAGP